MVWRNWEGRVLVCGRVGCAIVAPSRHRLCVGESAVIPCEGCGLVLERMWVDTLDEERADTYGGCG